ncbi:MAG: TlpA disulfide reductase family protein [Dehalococcoidia bacterium]
MTNPSKSSITPPPDRPAGSAPASPGRHPLVRFGLPFVAIALIAAAILALSGLPGSRRGPEPGSAELRQAEIGALEDGAPVRGQPAPDFALRSLDGQSVRLSELRGQVVLVNFWATWCGPCRAEMPDLQAVYEQEKADLVVLAVNVEGTSAEEARRLSIDFRDEMGLTFPIVLDSPDGAVFKQYKLRGLPDSFFVDREGIVREVSYGPMSRETIQRKLATTRKGDA